MTKVAIDLEACRAYLMARQRREIERQEVLRQQVTQAVRTAAAAILPRFPQVRRAYLLDPPCMLCAPHRMWILRWKGSSVRRSTLPCGGS